MSICGISYASRHFKNRYEIINRLGNESKLFNNFKCFNDQDIDNYFKEKYNEQHRHDQSIMSLLYKYMDRDLIIDDETYFEEGFNSEKSKKYPF